nr:RNA-binding protein [Anaerolineae bacterium]
MTKKLYVGNLSYSVTQGALEELFGSVGEVASVNVITDRMTGQSRGFAFVEMADSTAAQQAIAQLNGHVLDGRAIKVAEARPRQPRGFRDEPRGGRRRRF